LSVLAIKEQLLQNHKPGNWFLKADRKKPFGGEQVHQKCPSKGPGAACECPEALPVGY